MGIFKNIDDKINAFAKNLNANINQFPSGYSFEDVTIPQDKFEDRRIIWTDGAIGKAIFIQPNFTSTDFNSCTWNFVNFAWLQTLPPGSKEAPFWTKNLLTKVEFYTIEKNIDTLLSTSLENLEKIKLKDLK